MRPIEVAIGFFDGVHLGHQKIFSSMIERARVIGATTAVYTFSNHPKSVFSPGSGPMLVMTPEDKVAEIKSLGIDEIIIKEFTAETAEIHADAFVSYLKAEFPSLDTVFCGGNWRFGKGGEGSARLLREKGINTSEIGYAEVGGDIVSSTRIRTALLEGNVKLVNEMLGREYSLWGRVVKGKGLGKEIGFPTINLEIPFTPPIKNGVYLLDTPYGNAIANWGTAPTMKDKAWSKPMLEFHILNPAGEIENIPYGMRVAFKDFIRPEKKFDSVDELKRQIGKDISSVS